jgi:hypothetical protein
MKIRISLIAVLLFFFIVPAGPAQEYGKIRLLNQRAAFVIKLKNDYIDRVLVSYHIHHERNDNGTVVRINIDGQWRIVTAIEIVPLLKEAAYNHQQVVAHELFFYTDNGILDLVSALTIR